MTSTDVASPASGTKSISSKRPASIPETAADMWSHACDEAHEIPCLDDSTPDARVFAAPMIVPLFVASEASETEDESGDGQNAASEEPSNDTTFSEPEVRTAANDSLRPTALPLETPAETPEAQLARGVPLALVASLAVASIVLLALVGVIATKPLLRDAAASSPPPEAVPLPAPAPRRP